MTNLLANILQTTQVGDFLLIGNRFDSLAHTGHRAQNAVVTKNNTTSCLFAQTGKRKTYRFVLKKKDSLAIINANCFRIDGRKHILEGLHH